MSRPGVFLLLLPTTVALHGNGPAALLNLQAFLLLGGLNETLVEAANPITDGSKGKAFKDIAFLTSQVEETLCELVVVELLRLRIVERIAALQVLEPMIHKVGFELGEGLPRKLLSEDVPGLDALRKLVSDVLIRIRRTMIVLVRIWKMSRIDRFFFVDILYARWEGGSFEPFG